MQTLPLNPAFRSFMDTLHKLDARHKLPTGGDHLTMEVAQNPAALSRGHAFLRNKKQTPWEVIPLKKLMDR